MSLLLKRLLNRANSGLIALATLALFGGVVVCWTLTKSSPKVDARAGQRAQPQSLTLPLKNPRIVVFKAERRLELYADDKLVRTYKVGLGFSPVADKVREGDGATPEGDFYIFVKNNKSAYYLSLGVSYPNIEDAERGLRNKLITKAQYQSIVDANKKKAAPPQYTKLGGLIYIHGNGSSSDWTWGCVALENEQMKELYDVVSTGTPVTIKR
jgi:murein L,D-transpeptidase YafK